MVILWLSRHNPIPRQRAELTRLFGPHDLRQDVSPFESAAEIKRRMVAARADEIVCVAPLSVLRELLNFGVQPLTADMETCGPEHAEVTIQGRAGPRYIRFVRFQRLTSIEMTYREVAPC